MPAHVIDSVIFKDMYGTDELRQVFSDENLLQCWLDVEAALARAEAAVGLLPQEAAAEISRQARVALLDVAAIQRGINETTHELVPLVRYAKARRVVMCIGARPRRISPTPD